MVISNYQLLITNYHFDYRRRYKDLCQGTEDEERKHHRKVAIKVLRPDLARLLAPLTAHDAPAVFRAVDRAVLAHHSRPSGLPLILAGLAEHQAVFRSVTHNPFVVSAEVQKAQLDFRRAADGIRDYTIRDLHGYHLTFGHHLMTAGPPLPIERVDVAVAGAAPMNVKRSSCLIALNCR